MASGTITIGPVNIGCPACETTIPVPVTAELGFDDDRRPVLICTPDMADLWAHAWMHNDGEGADRD